MLLAVILSSNARPMNVSSGFNDIITMPDASQADDPWTCIARHCAYWEGVPFSMDRGLAAAKSRPSSGRKVNRLWLVKEWRERDQIWQIFR